MLKIRLAEICRFVGYLSHHGHLSGVGLARKPDGYSTNGVLQLASICCRPCHMPAATGPRLADGTRKRVAGKSAGIRRVALEICLESVRALQYVSLHHPAPRQRVKFQNGSRALSRGFPKPD